MKETEQKKQKKRNEQKETAYAFSFLDHFYLPFADNTRKKIAHNSL